jgi:hypothetical protein
MPDRMPSANDLSNSSSVWAPSLEEIGWYANVNTSISSAPSACRFQCPATQPLPDDASR